MNRLNYEHSMNLFCMFFYCVYMLYGFIFSILHRLLDIELLRHVSIFFIILALFHIVILLIYFYREIMLIDKDIKKLGKELEDILQDLEL